MIGRVRSETPRERSRTTSASDHRPPRAFGARLATRTSRCRRPFARRRATRARVAPSGRRPDREEEPACDGAPRWRRSTSSLAAAGRGTRRTGLTSKVAQRGSIGLSRTSRYVSRGGWASCWHARARLKRAPRVRQRQTSSGRFSFSSALGLYLKKFVTKCSYVNYHSAKISRHRAGESNARRYYSRRGIVSSPAGRRPPGRRVRARRHACDEHPRP